MRSGRSRRPLAVFTVALLLAFGAAVPAGAQGLDDLRAGRGANLPAAEHRAMWIGDLQFRIEPVGLILSNSIVHREHHEADGSTLYRGTYQQQGVDLNISPAFVEIGPRVEYRPINLFVYSVGYHALYFFGHLGYPLSFPTSDSDFGDDVAEELEEEGAEESGLAHRLMVQQTSQIQFGRIVVRDQITAYAHIFPNFEGPFIRERIYDTLQANYDAMISNGAFVLFEGWDGPGEARFLVGPYHEVVYAARAHLSRHRLGGVVVYIPADRWGGRTYRPRTYLQSGVNLIDANRQGRFNLQGGFGFDLRLRTRPGD